MGVTTNTRDNGVLRGGRADLWAGRTGVGAAVVIMSAVPEVKDLPQ